MNAGYSTWHPSQGHSTKQHLAFQQSRLRSAALKHVHAVNPRATPACESFDASLFDAWCEVSALRGAPVVVSTPAFGFSSLAERMLVLHPDDAVTLLWLPHEVEADWVKCGARMRRHETRPLRWVPGARSRRRQNAYVRAVDVACLPQHQLGSLTALVGAIGGGGNTDTRAWFDTATVHALLDLWCQARVAEGHTPESAQFLLALQVPVGVTLKAQS